MGRKPKHGNGLGSVYREKKHGKYTGKWIAQVYCGTYADGRPKPVKRYRDSRVEADRALREMKAELDQGRQVGTKSQAVGAYLDSWIDRAVRGKGELKTQLGYIRNVALMKPHIGHLALDKLTADHVERMLNDLRNRGGRNGRPLSTRSVQYALQTLRRALKRAVRHRIIAENVASLVEMPSGDRHEVQPFTEDEVQRFLDEVDKLQNTGLKALYYTGVLLGLREGELLGLRWQDVDLKRGRLCVRQQLQHITLAGEKATTKKLKTKESRRDLTLPNDVHAALRAHHDATRLQGRPCEGDALVFPSTAGTPLIPRNLIRHYKGVLKRASLPDRRFHDLRHTAATLMFARGLEAAEVQRVLGHASLAITTQTYIHWLPDRQERAAAVMNDFRSRRAAGD